MNLQESTARVTSVLWEENIQDFIDHLSTGEEPSDHILWHSLSLELMINQQVIIPVDDGVNAVFTTMTDVMKHIVDSMVVEEDLEDDLDEVESFINQYGSPVA